MTPWRATVARTWVPLMAVILLQLVTPPAVADLAKAVDRAIAASGIPRARIGVSVRDTRTGRQLVDVTADKARIPASNMKLLTTGAAVSEFELDHRFQTKLLLDGHRLVIVGGGDPALADPDLLATMQDTDGNQLNVENLLDLWAQAIQDAGGTSITEIVVDDRIFDKDLVHPDWPVNQVERHYSAEVSGLNFHRNVIWLRPQPRAGHIVMGETPSAPFLPIVNELKTGGDNTDGNVVDPHRRQLSEAITVRGTIIEPQVSPVEVTIHDPALFTGRLLADRLKRRGIMVESVRRATGQELLTGQMLPFDVVTPLSTVARECNHESKNLYAEALLKHLGRQRSGQPGSWKSGGAAVASIVQERIGTAATGLVVSDGSGWSRRNRVSPALMTRWLTSFADASEHSLAFRESLPGPGKGTLRSRFSAQDLHGCELLAKTGYITAVSSLSGYLIAPDGRTYAFSIMGNDLARIAPCKRLQEKIVEAIAADLARRAPRAKAPG